MQTLKSYVQGAWSAGTGTPQVLVNPTTEEPMAETSAEGIDLAAGVAHAREVGGPALRSMTFAERAALLGAMAKAIHEHRAELLDMGVDNGGGTRSDAKFDVDGASATLAHYAKLGEALGDVPYLHDGEGVQIGTTPRMVGRHVTVARQGVALLINAFNFPAWGFGEKAACALLMGMPVILKPATSTALLAHRIGELVADLLPEGAFSMVCGSAHELPAMLTHGDVIAFTGSGGTAAKLRGLPGVMSAAVRLTVEADSLNAAVLARDVEPGSDTYDMFLRQITKEVIQKTGQKCTATRRIIVAKDRLETVRDDLADRLGATVVGAPRHDGVRMGPVASASQHRDVLAGIERLASEGQVVLGQDAPKPIGVEEGKGYFVPVTLVVANEGATAVHDHEVFGPVVTLVPTDPTPEAMGAAVARGRGGLVCSAYTDDRKLAAALIGAIAPHHGRVCLGSKKIAGQAPGPGMVLPQLVHGGPGRAGGGEELGGLRGLSVYGQRLAIQGDRAMLDAILGKV